MIRWLYLILLCVFCVGCNSESIGPHLKYSAQFDNSKISQIESVLDDVAVRNELEVFSKDHKKMRFLSEGNPAFFTALYLNGDPIIIITNVGVADTLVLTITDYGKIPVAELELIAAEVILLLKSNINIKLAKIE